MKRFLSTLSTAALLLSLFPQNSFSMEKDVDDKRRAAGASGAVPTPDAVLARLEALDRENPGKSLSELMPLYNQLLTNMGTSLTLRSVAPEHDLALMKASALKPNAHYHSFEAAHRELSKKFSLYGTVVTSFEDRYKKQEISLQAFFERIDTSLRELSVPFVVSFDEEPTMAFLEYAEDKDQQDVLRNTPLTREVKKHKEEQLAEARLQASEARLQAAHADEETSSFKASITEIITFSSKLCKARIQLLCLKAQYVSDPNQREVILKEGMGVYINFASSVEAYEFVAVHDLMAIKQIKWVTFVESIKSFNMLRDLYNSRAQHEKHLFQSRFTRLHKRKLVEDLVFMYKAISPSNSQYDTIKSSILQHTSDDFDTCLGEIQNYQALGNHRDQILTLVGDARAYVRRYEAIIRNTKNLRYREMKDLLEKITTPARISREELGKLLFRDTESASISALHYTLMNTLNLKKTSRSQDDFQEALGTIYGFQNNLLKREVIFPLSEDNLSEFYDAYLNGLGSSIVELHNATLHFSAIFMSLGQYQEVVDHVNAFKTTYRKTNTERPFADLDLAEAISLAFLGNPERIMELERASIHRMQQKEEEKVRTKAKNIEDLQIKIAQLQADAEKLEQERRELKERQLAAQVSANARKKAAAVSFSGGRSMQEVEGEGGEKEAKLERHAKNEEERKRIADEASLTNTGEMKGSSASPSSEPFPVRVVEEKASFIPFAETVHLTKLQKRVEKQIERNIWKITPDELRQYYETFGCTTRSRGSHTVASLPSYDLVFLPYE